MEKKKNAIVFIDYENVHYNLIGNYQNVFQVFFFSKLKKYLNNKGYEILDSIAYCNFDLKDLHNAYHQTKLQQLGIDTRHTTNNGKNYAELQITADALELIYKNEEIDSIFLISNDKDMTPLIKAIKKTKASVNLILFKTNYDKILLEYPNNYIFIEDILSIDLEEIDKKEDMTSDVYDNLNKYMDSKNTGSKPYLNSLERYLEATTSWLKLFDYEIVRIFSNLEREGKIFVFYYDMPNNKDCVGITTMNYEALYLGYDSNNIRKITNYFTDDVLNSYYDKYKK